MYYERANNDARQRDKAVKDYQPENVTHRSVSSEAQHTKTITENGRTVTYDLTPEPGRLLDSSSTRPVSIKVDRNNGSSVIEPLQPLEPLEPIQNGGQTTTTQRRSKGSRGQDLLTTTTTTTSENHRILPVAPVSPVEPDTAYFEREELEPPSPLRPSPRLTVTYSPDSMDGPRSPAMRAALRSPGAMSGASLSPRSVQSNVSNPDDGCQVLFYNPLVYPVRKHRRPASRNGNMVVSIY